MRVSAFGLAAGWKLCVKSTRPLKVALWKVRDCESRDYS
jgi:hypothetical protein